jgi:hypothetical protein
MEKTFEMVGFKHVTVEGVANYWSYLDSNGTIAMLWDLKNQDRMDNLMMKDNFNMTTYITDKWNVEVNSPLFDDIMMELHEDLVDARFALEYAYSSGKKDVDCMSGKYFRNLDKLPESAVWNPPSYYPQAEPVIFTDISGEFAEYCQEQTVNHVVEATICTGHSGDVDGSGYTPQELTWSITGAADFNAFQDIVDSLFQMHQYHELKVVAILK